MPPAQKKTEAKSATPEAPKVEDSPPVEAPEVRESSVQTAKVVKENDGREAVHTNSGVLFGYK